MDILGMPNHIQAQKHFIQMLKDIKSCNILMKCFTLVPLVFRCTSAGLSEPTFLLLMVTLNHMDVRLHGSISYLSR